LKVRKALFIRFLIAIGLGIIVAGLLSEFAFRFLGNTTSRSPKRIELVIPAGTAEKVAQGEVVLPAEQIFVVGDTLVVYNEDKIAHTLGPLFIPSGASASLKLDTPENMVFACSFEPSQYFGLDVREALTLSTRIEGILIAGIPMGFLLSLYSLILLPLKPKKTTLEL
jgi:hypothetical protein